MDAVTTVAENTVNGGGIKEMAIGFFAGIGAAVATKLVATAVKKVMTVAKQKAAEKKAVKPAEPSSEANATA